jgi:ABC-type transport system involved in cytochrome bd biosynthesis fused ATPase/permease subunit
MRDNKPAAASVNPRTVSVAFLVAGATLMLLSWIWPLLFTGRQQWTEDEAQQFTQSSAHLHELIDQYSEKSPAKRSTALTDEMKKTHDEVAELRGQLASARGWPDRIARLLRYVGIAAAIIGAALFFATGPHS